MIELFLDEATRFVHPEQTLERQQGLTKPLSPRLRQVLECLLRGDGAKQAAARLGLSIHTVNDYVKDLYRRFGVSSRSELLALFVSRSATDV
ncbi:MAG TPA: helix-turn-helix transcriptional regulator [Tepidisphaeraceae bacterium]|nr:helix-turn-helix transcriptional regulator [Tepidisphaeraceae bacterium]